MVVIVPLGSTRRTRKLCWSAIRIPPAASTTTPVGWLSCAFVAGPPSPAKPAMPESGDRRDDAVRCDLADAVAQVGDEHVARRIDGHPHGLVELCADGRTAVAEIPGDARAREKLQRGRRHRGGRARRDAEAGQSHQREDQATGSDEEHTAGHGGTSWRESLADTGQGRPSARRYSVSARRARCERLSAAHPRHEALAAQLDRIGDPFGRDFGDDLVEPWGGRGP